MPSAKFLYRILVALSLVALMAAILPVLYFQWHCSEAPTLSVISGALRLRDSKLPCAEIEPNIYMFRAGDVKVAGNGVGALQFPYNAHLASLGWTFTDQMGAGLTYKRNEQRLNMLFASCGPSYGVAVLYQDPVTGKDMPYHRPFNLFSR